MPQPALNSDKGVIVTVGILNYKDRCEMVFPMASDSVTVDSQNACQKACEAMVSFGVPLLQSCLSEGAEITFVAGEGMVPGMKPFRNDFAPNLYPGFAVGDPMPSQVAALLVFPSDGATDVGSTARYKQGRNFLPAISENQVTIDIISNTLKGVIQVFVDALIDGIAEGGGASTWYRVRRAVRTAGQELGNVVAGAVRDYVVTQKRRLIPRY